MTHDDSLLVWHRRTAWAALTIGVVAGLARALEAVQDSLLFNDGPRFIAAAEAMLRGDWRAALAEPYHPLTSLCAAAVSLLAGVSIESAAESVGVIAGVVGSVSLYLLVRMQGDARVALVAGLLFAVHPRLVPISSGVQSDGLYLGLLVTAAMLAWRALRGGGLRSAAACGVVCALAYLTRPEGLLVALVLGAWLALDWLRGERRFARTLALGATFALGLCLTAAPYVLALHDITGTWTLTQKKSVVAIAGLDASASTVASVVEPSASSATPAPESSTSAPARAQSLTMRGLAALKEVLHDFLRAFMPALLALALLGWRRGRPSDATLYLVSYFAALAPILLALHLHSGYVSRRHWLAAVALLLPLAARGLLRVVDLATERVALLRRRPWLLPALGALAVVLFLADGLRPKEDPHKQARQAAAEWLRAAARPDSVATLRARDAYYAGATRHVALEHLGSPEALLADARGAGARFLLVDESLFPGPRALVPAGVVELHRVSYASGAVLVFELSPVSTGAAE